MLYALIIMLKYIDFLYQNRYLYSVPGNKEPILEDPVPVQEPEPNNFGTNPSIILSLNHVLVGLK